jgi:hypothetical protein
VQILLFKNALNEYFKQPKEHRDKNSFFSNINYQVKYNLIV